MTIPDVVRRLKVCPLTAAGFGLFGVIFATLALWGFPRPPINDFPWAWRPPLWQPILAPIERLQETTVEPDRNVAAAQWNSPYCLAWEDGCTECRRTAVGRESQCQPQLEAGATNCDRHEIICSDAGDERRLHQVCSEYVRSPVGIDEGIIKQKQTIFYVYWYFDWQNFRWQNSSISADKIYTISKTRNSWMYYVDSYLFIEKVPKTKEIDTDLNADTYSALRLHRQHYTARSTEGPSGLPLHDGKETIGIICMSGFRE